MRTRTLSGTPVSPLAVAVALTIVVAPQFGCVSLLTSGFAEDNFAGAKRDHIYGFYLQQIGKLRDLGACKEAAAYFVERFSPKTRPGFMGSRRSSELSDEDVAALDDKIKAEANALKGSCEQSSLPRLEGERRFEALADTMKSLATLPIGEQEQQALLRRADTVDLLRARATAADGEKAYNAGDYYKALSDLSYAVAIARGVKTATSEEQDVFVQLERRYRDTYLAMLLSNAEAAARSPDTAHRAVVYLGRAYELSRGAETRAGPTRTSLAATIGAQIAIAPERETKPASTMPNASSTRPL